MVMREQITRPHDWGRAFWGYRSISISNMNS